MSAPITSGAPSRFEDLASRCLDGTLSPAEETEFLRMLNDPASRAAFAELDRINLELLASLATPLPDAEMLRLVRKDACGVASSTSSQRAEAVMDRVQRPSVRRTVRRDRANRSAWGLPLGIAALLALTLGGFLLLRTNAEPKQAVANVVAITGKVKRSNEGVEAPLGENAVLLEGDTVQTGVYDTLSILYPDGTRLFLKPETTLRLQDPSNPATSVAAGKWIFITRGSVSASVKPQPAGAPMKFLSHHAEARVVGTQLALDVRQSSTRLDVSEGKVRMTSLETQKSVDVDTGKYAVAAVDLPLSVLDIKPAPVAATVSVEPTAPKWEPAFATNDLSDWKITRGNARIEDGVVILEAVPRNDASRIETLKSYLAVEIECDVRLTYTHLAEFQLEGYRWFFQIDLGPDQKSEWHKFQATFAGQTRQAWLDGHPLTLERGGGPGPRGGPIAFFISHQGKLEIRGAKIRTPLGTK